MTDYKYRIIFSDKSYQDFNTRDELIDFINQVGYQSEEIIIFKELTPIVITRRIVTNFEEFIAKEAKDASSNFS